MWHGLDFNFSSRNLCLEADWCWIKGQERVRAKEIWQDELGRGVFVCGFWSMWETHLGRGQVTAQGPAGNVNWAGTALQRELLHTVLPCCVARSAAHVLRTSRCVRDHVFRFGCFLCRRPLISRQESFRPEVLITVVLALPSPSLNTPAHLPY